MDQQENQEEDTQIPLQQQQQQHSRLGRIEITDSTPDDLILEYVLFSFFFK